jgi:hypothetical protein
MRYYSLNALEDLLGCCLPVLQGSSLLSLMLLLSMYCPAALAPGLLENIRESMYLSAVLQCDDLSSNILLYCMQVAIL